MKNKKRVVHVLGEVDVAVGNGPATLIQTCNGDDDGGGEYDLIRPMVSGQPLPPGGKIAHLKPCDDRDDHYECEVVDVETLASGSGPPQVANLSYRRGWENIFGKSKNSAN